MLIRAFWLILVIALYCLSPSNAFAQIVNVLSEMAQNEKNGLSGEVEAGLNWKTGNTEQLTLTGGIGTRFRYDSSNVYLIWAGKYASAGDLKFEQRIMTHLRYRYEVFDWLAAELFGQHEYNEFRRLQRRELAGLGPRFRLLDQKRFAASLGLAYMLENEELDDALDSDGLFVADAGETKTYHRLSSYLSFSVALKSIVTLDGTVFFQPRFDEFADYRVLTDVTVALSLTKIIGVGLSGILAYDSTPPIGVKQLDTALIGKLVIKLDTIPI